ncbi:prepilin-type N-terminal cleavage/methylation domain-containing protein [Alkalihalophilus marmarensis]|nr:competence type IV pilus minor pilin ComGF [Alkalihalophilus marmarensis]MCM3489049.1 prepilin-type N-terminal cleavage/methylation domain-containing protein [Alkalihalophilus marmarensis]
MQTIRVQIKGSIICVYMLGNEQGFTLLEILLVLSILGVLVFVFPTIMGVIQHTKNHDTHEKLEMMVFFNQLTDEVKESRTIRIEGREVVLIKGDDTEVSYRQLDTGQIRRFSNNSGYVPMLYNVQSFYCEREQKKYRCTVTLINGEVMSRSMMPMYGVY